jgi:hypothetical protein
MSSNDPCWPGSPWTAPVLFSGLCLLLMLSLWGSARAQTSHHRETIAVLDFTLNLALANADDAEYDQLPVALASQHMRAQVAKSGAYLLVEANPDAHATTELSCTSDACAVQVGKALGVQRVIRGQVTKISALIWVVSARLIDVPTAMPLHAETVQFRGNIAEVMPRVMAILWRRMNESG